MVMSADHGNDNLEDGQGQVLAATDNVTHIDANCCAIAETPIHPAPQLLKSFKC